MYAESPPSTAPTVRGYSIPPSNRTNVPYHISVLTTVPRKSFPLVYLDICISVQATRSPSNDNAAVYKTYRCTSQSLLTGVQKPTIYEYTRQKKSEVQYKGPQAKILYGTVYKTQPSPLIHLRYMRPVTLTPTNQQRQQQQKTNILLSVPPASYV